MIYVLLLEQDKIYVGYSERPVGARFIEHFTKNGSRWTTTYRPLQVLKIAEGGRDEENEMTLRMMDKYGWWNVRGGNWCRVEMDACPAALLEWQSFSPPVQINKKRSAPTISTPQKIMAVKSKDQDAQITKKGRWGQISSIAVNQSQVQVSKTSISQAKRTINVVAPTPNYQRANQTQKASDKTKRASDAVVPTPKYQRATQTQKVKGCQRCGRDSHVASKCFASKHVEGYVIVDTTCVVVSDSSSSEDEPKCFRCGRDSHFAASCYAKIHVDGHFLIPKSK